VDELVERRDVEARRDFDAALMSEHEGKRPGAGGGDEFDGQKEGSGGLRRLAVAGKVAIQRALGKLVLLAEGGQGQSARAVSIYVLIY